MRIDTAFHAIKYVSPIRINHRLRLCKGTDFLLEEGVSVTLEAALDPIQVRHAWLSEVGAGAGGRFRDNEAYSQGVDVPLYCGIPDGRDLQSMVIEVKGVKFVSTVDVHSLRGVLDQMWLS